MRERIRPAPEAIERLRQLGEKKILQFFDEVTLGSIRSLVDVLPVVHGFRPQSEAGIKQQKSSLAKKLSNKIGGTDREHFALYMIWRAWAWEQLGDPDAVEHLIDDLEESFGRPREQENETENDRLSTITFVTGLKELSLENKCSREKIIRLLEFSPLVIDDAIQQIVNSSKSEADIERDAVITTLPDRLREGEKEFQSIKERLTALSLDVEEATTRGNTLEQKLEGHNQTLRTLSDAVERIQQAIHSANEIDKRGTEALDRLEKRADELATQIKSGSTRQDAIDSRLDATVRSFEEAVREIKSVLDPIQNKLVGITPTGAEAVESIVKELGALSAKVLALTQASDTNDIESLRKRLDALEMGSVKNQTKQDGLSISTILDASSEAPKTLADAEKIVGALAASLQSLGLKKSASVLLAEEIAAAILTSQTVIFKGALANLVARKCAYTLSKGLSWTVSIPIGLMDGAPLRSALHSLAVKSELNVPSIVIDGINRSALDATKDALVEYGTDYSTNHGSSIFCFVSLVSGIASLPVEVEHLELGPVFDLDYLDWRISTEASGANIGGVVAKDVTKSLRPKLVQDAADDIDEALRVVRKFGRKRNPRIERSVVAAYAALKNIRRGRADASPMQSLAYGWLVPLWVALEVSKEDADSELDGGKCDSTSVDVRIASMLGNEKFGSERKEATE